MNIEEVQRRLWEQSQAHKQNRELGTPMFPTNPYGGRIRNLMDLMHNPTWIVAACDCVLKRSRGKASGVDGVTVYEFNKNRESHLEQLRLELKRGTYQPLPLRRVEIPKANGKMRQLGIPCLRDKIVQEAIRMALEPIFEVEFHDSSYGFRPNRNRINQELPSPTSRIPNWKQTAGSTKVSDPGAWTSSGRLWFATAFVVVAARSRVRPKPRTRTISDLSTALPPSKWRTI